MPRVKIAERKDPLKEIILGRKAMMKLTIAEVDEHNKPIPGTEEHYSCDTLLLSVGLLPENELSKTAGVELSRVTNGPTVNEQLETSVEGIFACGNVLHVHDLVDFVSEEAAMAGRNAARFVWGEVSEDRSRELPIRVEGGPRYTVPCTIDPDKMPDQLTVRFRVGSVMKDRYVCLYLDGERVLRRRRQIMAPGEMEELVFKKSMFEAHPELHEILIRVEEA